MSEPILVLYSCELCGLLDDECPVAPRRPGQDVVEWFEGMLEEVRHYHSLASPGCQPRELQNIKVPVDKDAEGIGYGTPGGKERGAT